MNVLKNFLESGTYQHIDDCGRTRCIIHRFVASDCLNTGVPLENIMVVTPPLHPIAGMECYTSHFYYRRSGKDVEGFVRERFGDDFEPVKICVKTPNKVSGLFFQIHGIQLYFPVGDSASLYKKYKSLEQTHIEPYYFEDLSKLHIARESENLAHIFKSLLTYVFVNYISVDVPYPERAVTDDHFEISEGIIRYYRELRKEIAGNITIVRPYSDKLFRLDENGTPIGIKIPDARFIAPLKQYIYNIRYDTLYLDSFLDLKCIANLYTDAEDFRKDISFKTFSSKRDVLYFLAVKKSERSLSSMRSTLLPYNIDPYLLSYYPITHRDIPVMIQNVEDGDIEHAKAVARCWYENKVNVGYYKSLLEEYPTSFSPIQGERWMIYPEGEPFGDGNGPILNLLKYDDGSYGAILKLREGTHHFAKLEVPASIPPSQPGMLKNSSNSCYLDVLMMCIMLGAPDKLRRAIATSEITIERNESGNVIIPFEENSNVYKVCTRMNTDSNKEGCVREYIQQFREEYIKTSHQVTTGAIVESVTTSGYRKILSNLISYVNDGHEHEPSSIYGDLAQMFKALEFRVPIVTKESNPRVTYKPRTFVHFGEYLRQREKIRPRHITNEGEYYYWDKVNDDVLVFDNEGVWLKDYDTVGTETYQDTTYRKRSSFGEYILGGRYRLYGAIIHQGKVPVSHDYSSPGNHFVLYLRPKYDIEKWYLYNDIGPTLTPQDTLPAIVFKGTKRSRPSMFFYEKVQ